MCVSVVYMHVRTWICIPTYVYTQRLKKIDSWVSSIVLCLISLIQGLPANLVHFFFCLDQHLVNSRGPLLSVSLSAWVANMCGRHSLIHGCWDPHAWEQVLPAIEPPLQPQIWTLSSTLLPSGHLGCYALSVVHISTKGSFILPANSARTGWSHPRFFSLLPILHPDH